jgi:hypothetical protein
MRLRSSRPTFNPFLALLPISLARVRSEFIRLHLRSHGTSLPLDPTVLWPRLSVWAPTHHSSSREMPTFTTLLYDRQLT